MAITAITVLPVLNINTLIIVITVVSDITVIRASVVAGAWDGAPEPKTLEKS